MNLLGILAIFIQNLLFSEAQKLLDSLLTGSFTTGWEPFIWYFIKDEADI